MPDPIDTRSRLYLWWCKTWFGNSCVLCNPRLSGYLGPAHMGCVAHHEALQEGRRQDAPEWEW